MRNELARTSSTTTVSRRAIRPRRPAQLDFALPASPVPQRRVKSSSASRPCPRIRAEWWFDQMRQLVAEGREMDAPGVF